MKFVKLQLHNVPGKGTTTEWRMVLESAEDVMLYSDFEAGILTNAFLRLEMTKEGTYEVAHAGDKRVGTVGTLLNIAMLRCKEGETFYPIHELSKIHDRKAQSMVRLIGTFGAVCVNQAGGYCDYAGFVKTWQAEVLQTVEKADVGFPIEREAMTADVLILENQDHAYDMFATLVEQRTGTRPEVIANLKEKDQAWVTRSMLNAGTIAFSSHFQDADQVTELMHVFLRMPRKRVIVGTWTRDAHRLMGHPLYAQVTERHDVELIMLNA